MPLALIDLQVKCLHFHLSFFMRRIVIIKSTTVMQQNTTAAIPKSTCTEISPGLPALSQKAQIMAESKRSNVMIALVSVAIFIVVSPFQVS